MIECTLQEAVERCKKNGGDFQENDSDSKNIYYIGRAGYLCYKNNQSQEKGNAELYPEMFCKTFTYNPPKQSVFQNWNNAPKGSVQEVCRKEGYNFAIDKIMESCKIGIYDGALRSMIENLKEP